MWAALQNSTLPLPAPCGAGLFTQCLRLALLSHLAASRQKGGGCLDTLEAVGCK